MEPTTRFFFLSEDGLESSIRQRREWGDVRGKSSSGVNTRDVLVGGTEAGSQLSFVSHKYL